ERGAIALGLADVTYLVHVDRDEVAAPGDDVTRPVRRLRIRAALAANGVVVADVAGDRADRPGEQASPEAVKEPRIHAGDAGDAHRAREAVGQDRFGAVLTLDGLEPLDDQIQ